MSGYPQQQNQDMFPEASFQDEGCLALQCILMLSLLDHIKQQLEGLNKAIGKMAEMRGIIQGMASYSNLASQLPYNDAQQFGINAFSKDGQTMLLPLPLTSFYFGMEQWLAMAATPDVTTNKPLSDPAKLAENDNYNIVLLGNQRSSDNQHSSLSSSRMLYECTRCDAAFGRRQDWVRHLASLQHRTRQNQTLSDRRCRYCQKLFSRRDVASHHEKIVHHRSSGRKHRK